MRSINIIKQFMDYNQYIGAQKWRYISTSNNWYNFTLLKAISHHITGTFQIQFLKLCYNYLNNTPDGSKEKQKMKPTAFKIIYIYIYMPNMLKK